MTDQLNTLEAAKAHVLACRVELEDLIKAQAILEAELPRVQAQLTAANERLTRLKAPGARVANQKAEIAALKRRINEASHQESSHVL